MQYIASHEQWRACLNTPATLEKIILIPLHRKGKILFWLWTTPRTEAKGEKIAECECGLKKLDDIKTSGL